MAKPYRIIPTITAQIANRFWNRITTQPTGCWTVTKRKHGYGEFNISGTNYRAHRVAYAIYYRTDPNQQFVCHTCDNPPCVNPLHLWLGDQFDNMRDARDKGRCNTDMSWAIKRGDEHFSRKHPEQVLRGEANGASKLTADQVRELRNLYATTDVTQYALAEQFNISQTVVSNIIHRKRWAHID